MPSADEPDFGFLNDEESAPQPADSFSFHEPAAESPEAAAPTFEPAPEPAPDPGTSQPKQKRKNQVRPVGAEPANKQVVSDGGSSVDPVRRTKKKAGRSSQTQVAPSKRSDTPSSQPSPASQRPPASQTVSRSTFLSLAGFAVLVSLVLLLQLLGLVHLGPGHQLESLPDVAPLQPGEFQLVPETASLPAGHELQLGQEVRFGDVLFTPTKVVREPITFTNTTTGELADHLQATDVLKLYFTIKNVSPSVAFPPWDVALMSHRSPMDGADESTKANSWLLVDGANGRQRVLNFSHSLNNSLQMTGLASRQVLQPDESRQTFIASSDGASEWLHDPAKLKWRIQLRKGLHPGSEHSVTTLIDVLFSNSDIQG